MNFDISIASPEDHNAVYGLLRQYSYDCGWADRFEHAHAWSHAGSLITDGVCFVAKQDGVVTGLIAAKRIDVGIVIIPDLETVHIYTMPGNRSFVLILALFRAVESYADEHRIKVLFHQMDYPAAIEDRLSNGHGVEALFKRRHYTQVDVAYVTPNFTRAGVTYLYNGRRRRTNRQKGG